MNDCETYQRVSPSNFVQTYIVTLFAADDTAGKVALLLNSRVSPAGAAKAIVRLPVASCLKITTIVFIASVEPGIAVGNVTVALPVNDTL